MRHRGRTWNAIAAAVLGIGTLGLAVAGGAAPAMTTVAGTIQSAAPGLVVVTTESGQTKVKTTAATWFIGRRPATLSQVKTGDFIGVDAKKGGEGILTAVAINIFPASWKGRIREGQWLMRSGDTMTNAVVTQYVTRVSGHSVSLAYEGRTWAIQVPPSAAIHRLTLITAAALKPGVRVTVRGTENADGSVTASFIEMDETGG